MPASRTVNSRLASSNAVQRSYPGGWLVFLIALWLLAYVFLKVERPLALQGNAAFLAMRHAVAAAFGSLDAPANLEHVLFGVMCAATAYILIHCAMYCRRPNAPSKRRPAWVERHRPSLPVRLTRLASALVQMYRPTALRLGAACVEAGGGRSRLERTLRQTFVAVFALWMLSTWGDWAYGWTSLATLLLAVGLVAWPALNWEHFIATLDQAPQRLIVAVSGVIWIHMDLLWKVEQLWAGKNEAEHALRHLSLSLGGLLATFALLEGIDRLRVWRKRAAPALGTAVAP